MNNTKNTLLIVAFVVVFALFLVFGGGAMTGGMMNGGMQNGLMGERSWMWFPTLITLGLGVVLGWVIFRKKD